MTPSKKCNWYYRLAIGLLLLLLADIFFLLWLVYENNKVQLVEYAFLVVALLLTFFTSYFHIKADQLYRKLYPTDPYCP